MPDTDHPTLAEKWITRLKNHPIFAATIIVGTVLGGIVSVTDSAKKLLAAVGLGGSGPPSFVVNIPPAAAPPPPTGRPATPSERTASCVSAIDTARYKTELLNVGRLILDGQQMVFHEGAPPGLYEKIKSWEDTAYAELDAIDKYHSKSTAFSFEFEHWKSQNRGPSPGRNASVNAAQMERNLGHLRRVEQFLQRVIAEAQVRACPS